MSRIALRRAVLAAAVAAAPVAVAGPAATALLGPRDDLTPADRAKVERVVAPPADPGAPEPFEAMSGGAATSRAAPGRDAFDQTVAGLDPAAADRVLGGRAVFRKLWVAAPTSTLGSDGLGPLYIARACDACHVRDGRGRAPTAAGGDGFLLRLGRPAAGGGVEPDPVYGAELQSEAVAGLSAEGRPEVAWTARPVVLADGSTVDLRAPAFHVADLAYGPLDPATRFSARVATPMIGLGLLAAIDEGDILAAADPDDADGDGISGRPNRVVDGATGRTAIGRFGWRAGKATLADQVATAFSLDMGLSNAAAPDPFGDCTAAETACRAMPTGVQPAQGPFEVPPDLLAATVAYTAAVAVPVRRSPADPEVLRGKALFHASGCAACHRPAFVTRRDAEPRALAFQLIRPYTDLLLHDMGEGLADDLPEGAATGREWRTPPLWGLGLLPVVNGAGTGLLHDGRARTPLEAILWHGGEAEAARRAVTALSQDDRNALVAFLNSL